MTEKDRIGQDPEESRVEAIARLSDFARYPIHDVDTIATRMEHAAKRLRKLAENFRNEQVKPSNVLGDILSEYLAATGSNGTYFDNLVRDVEQLRADRARGAK